MIYLPCWKIDCTGKNNITKYKHLLELLFLLTDETNKNTWNQSKIQETILFSSSKT